MLKQQEGKQGKARTGKPNKDRKDSKARRERQRQKDKGHEGVCHAKAARAQARQKQASNLTRAQSQLLVHTSKPCSSQGGSDTVRPVTVRFDLVFFIIEETDGEGVPLAATNRSRIKPEIRD